MPLMALSEDDLLGLAALLCRCCQVNLKWMVKILGAIVLPTTGFLSASVADDIHCSTTEPELIRYNNFRFPVAFHGFA